MTKPNVKDFVGVVNVNADITPITRQPIDQVDSSDWKDLPIHELSAQLATLSNRAQIATNIGNYPLLIQINRGITRLKFIINEKSNDDDAGLIR